MAVEVVDAGAVVVAVAQGDRRQEDGRRRKEGKEDLRVFRTLPYVVYGCAVVLVVKLTTISPVKLLINTAFSLLVQRANWTMANRVGRRGVDSWTRGRFRTLYSSGSSLLTTSLSATARKCAQIQKVFALCIREAEKYFEPSAP